jgi:hypothetical protein
MPPAGARGDRCEGASAVESLPLAAGERLTLLIEALHAALDASAEEWGVGISGPPPCEGRYDPGLDRRYQAWRREVLALLAHLPEWQRRAKAVYPATLLDVAEDERRCRAWVRWGRPAAIAFAADLFGRLPIDPPPGTAGMGDSAPLPSAESSSNDPARLEFHRQLREAWNRAPKKPNGEPNMDRLAEEMERDESTLRRYIRRYGWPAEITPLRIKKSARIMTE